MSILASHTKCSPDPRDSPFYHSWPDMLPLLISHIHSSSYSYPQAAIMRLDMIYPNIPMPPIVPLHLLWITRAVTNTPIYNNTSKTNFVTQSWIIICISASLSWPHTHKNSLISFVSLLWPSSVSTDLILFTETFERFAKKTQSW